MDIFVGLNCVVHFHGMDVVGQCCVTWDTRIAFLSSPSICSVCCYLLFSLSAFAFSRHLVFHSLFYFCFLLVHSAVLRMFVRRDWTHSTFSFSMIVAWLNAVLH